MAKNSPFYLIILFILCQGQGQGQGQHLTFRAWNSTTNSYNASDTFPTVGVADDYGPRAQADEYFHLGIDYNSAYNDGSSDLWDMINAPESGIVVDINRLWTSSFNYKQLCYEAGDHRYIFGHVYDNTSTTYNFENDSTITLKKMIRPAGSNTDRWAQILILGVDTLVYGQIVGEVEFGGDTFTTTNIVTSGNPLVPLGTSATTGAHLHLNTIPLNKNHSTGSTYHNSNPLQFINYPSPPKELKLNSKKDTNSIIIQYPGNTVSPIACRVKMNTMIQPNGKRFNHIFDVDKVRFFIKKTTFTNDTFNLIQGPYRESEIILGGILGEDLKNHPKKKFGIDWWKYTGVASHAYNGGNTYKNHAYDIYHFSDFDTRIHKNDVINDGTKIYADIPQTARYNDGVYKIFSRVTDVRGNHTSSDTLAFKLDNFKPFIEEAKATINDNITIYEESCNIKLTRPKIS